MKRPLRPEETRLWGLVAATVRLPSRRRAPPPPPPQGGPAGLAEAVALSRRPAPVAIPEGFRIGGAVSRPGGAARTPAGAPQTTEGIEPNRRRRIARGRDPVSARLDLHGYDQNRARARLVAFLRDAQADGMRAVLVITGKGVLGEGVLRRRAPEWLADPALRSVVAGLSPADPRDGGTGAWYVALKRKPR